MHSDLKLRPLGFWKSTLYFGLPGLLLYLGLHHAMPLLQLLGYPDIFLFPFFLWLPIIPLLLVSVLIFRRENRLNPEWSFTDRFRLTKLKRSDVLWVLGGIFAVIIFDFILLAPVSGWLATLPGFEPPDHFPVLFHPLKAIELPLASFLDVQLRGNWTLLLATMILHSTAIIAEEVFWRGYILPRHESAFGKYAWLVNGLLWAYVFHFFMMWNFISFLPSMLITPYIAQKTGNTWTAVLIHGVPNTILWLILLMGVLGAG